MNKALRIRVCGRVQGVGFRYWALRAARNLSLSGWVRNEDDGSVSAHCEGPAEDLSAFVALLRQGPPGSRVDRVETREEPPRGDREGFSVVY